MLRSLYYYRTTHNDNNIRHRFFSRSYIIVVYSDLRFRPLTVAIVFVRYQDRRNKKIKIKSKTFIKYDRARELGNLYHPPILCEWRTKKAIHIKFKNSKLVETIYARLI